VLALLGQKGEPEETVTEEEVRTIIAEAENAGVLERDEREMISGVMRLADRSARALMTPRREVEVIDLADTADEIRAQLRADEALAPAGAGWRAGFDHRRRRGQGC
jgi:putative hemolysin